MVDRNFQPLGKCIYYRCTYTVKTSGYLVPSTAKLSSCMKDGEYNFHGRNPRFVVDSHRDTPSVIYDGNGIIFLNFDIDYITKSRKCLIHCIIYDLVDQMVKSADGCTSDVHTRSFSDRFQTFQYLDLICSVFCTHPYPPKFLFKNQFSLRSPGTPC